MDLFDDIEPAIPFVIHSPIEHRVEWNGNLGGYEIEIPNGSLFYAESFFDTGFSDRCVRYFEEAANVDGRDIDWRSLTEQDIGQIEFTNIAWKQDSIRLYGRSIPLPRLTSWYGDTGKSYTYSGVQSAPNEWNSGLLAIRKRIEKCTESRFNSVLMNWYRDGNDHISWHSDDERELGANPVVASANFGESRDFIIRRKEDRSQKLKIPLRHGTLLIMKGALQHHWEHSVPKRKNVTGSRFNLTFRDICDAN